jgi:hypothetical protein
MGVVDARIDDADHHRPVATGDRPRLRGLDLIHVPLQRGEVVRAGCGHIGERGLLTRRHGTEFRVEPAGERARCRGVLDTVVLEQLPTERCAVRPCDRHADLAVAVDERAACLADSAGGAGRDRCPLVEHQVRLHRASAHLLDPSREQQHDHHGSQRRSRDPHEPWHCQPPNTPRSSTVRPFHGQAVSLASCEGPGSRGLG